MKEKKRMKKIEKKLRKRKNRIKKIKERIKKKKNATKENRKKEKNILNFSFDVMIYNRFIDHPSLNESVRG